MADPREGLAARTASLTVGSADEAAESESAFNLTIDDGFVSQAAGADGDDAEPARQPAATQKKKKKKSKSKKVKITGFEDNFQEGPITPAAFQEEQKLYDPLVTLIAIRRFQAKRVMDNERTHVFSSWMSYGGVDMSAKMFGGLDQKDLKELDADEIIQARATSVIPENRQGWEVDFEKVAKGFLSTHVPDYFAHDTAKEVNKVTGVLRSFLNYLLYHNVCPEYADNILAARNVVDEAQTELLKIHEAALWSPGDFNMACSTLFGGELMGSYTGDAEWRKEAGDNIEREGVMGLPTDAARKIVMYAIAGAGTEEQALLFREKATENSVEAVKLEDVAAFEVVDIVQPDEEVKAFYAESAPDLQIVGKVKARVWEDPAEPPEDCEQPTGLGDSNDGGAVDYGVPGGGQGINNAWDYDFEFLVDEGLLRFVFRGMKLRADVWELEGCGGLYYFDKVVGIYCSFYTVLNNGLMNGWKEPRPYVKAAVDADEAKQVEQLEAEPEQALGGGDTTGLSGSADVASNLAEPSATRVAPAARRPALDEDLANSGGTDGRPEEPSLLHAVQA
ncbi:hypothetical protein KEM52_004238 [Ascosphaera acerosa]|nr:hypothetical protein KEM52_004238 [Ascosphaera acerosa]